MIGARCKRKKSLKRLRYPVISPGSRSKIEDNPSPILSFINKYTPNLSAVQLQSEFELCCRVSCQLSVYTGNQQRAIHLCKIRSGVACSSFLGNWATIRGLRSICTVPLSLPVKPRAGLRQPPEPTTRSVKIKRGHRRARTSSLYRMMWSDLDV